MFDMVVVLLGYKQIDYLWIIMFCEIVVYFVFDVLVLGGIFVVKVLVGGIEVELQKLLCLKFDKVYNVKLLLLWLDSLEKFVVVFGFKGGNEEGVEVF